MSLLRRRLAAVEARRSVADDAAVDGSRRESLWASLNGDATDRPPPLPPDTAEDADYRRRLIREFCGGDE